MLRKKISWMVLGIGLLTGLLVGLPGSGGALAAEPAADKHRGEQLFRRALVGVEKVDGRLLLFWNREQPDPLQADFTMSDCGAELQPTEANLRRMIGKPCYGWATTVKGEMVLYRLEFPCR